ncbi:MAG TPA: nucleotidyltransferase domain-containing protein [Spirochaetota bacterium]|nr:nucleotidyltransferase domain-containing protein [Spirochaetota bacterium]
MQKNADIKKITGEVAKNARELFGNRLFSVILYGSYARGDYDDQSDMDIMLLVNMPQEEYQLFRDRISTLSSSLSLEYDITVSIKVKDSNIITHYKNSVPFYKNILEDGVTIDAG